jgi:hypothetical protein
MTLQIRPSEKEGGKPILHAQQLIRDEHEFHRQVAPEPDAEPIIGCGDPP